MERLKVLIIGGDSYIGSNFIKKYSNSRNIDMEIISRKKTHEKEIVISDLFTLNEKHFKGKDVIISFIGIAHIKEKGNEELFFSVNEKLVKYLGKLASECGVYKFLQLSTMSVYGDKSRISNKTEEFPITSYGISKLNADNYLLGIANSNFNVYLIRPPMIYGDNAPGNWKKLVKFIKYSPILPFKNVPNKRDFLFIENISIYIYDILLYSLRSGIFLISDDFSLSISEIVENLKKNYQSKGLSINHKFLSIPLKLVSNSIYLKIFDNFEVIPNYTPVSEKLISKEEVLKRLS